MPPPSKDSLANVGISACLAGEYVRYDGGHKYNANIVENLGRFFTFPVCPEVGCGLPVPREPMRLEGDPADPRLITVKTRQDLTAQMTECCQNKLADLAKEKLSGFIFKSRSPSSGLRDVPVYRDDAV